MLCDIIVDNDNITIQPIKQNKYDNRQKAKEMKDIETLDTEWEGLFKGSQNYPMHSFDDFNCGYDYVSDEFQELKYLPGDPFGISGHMIMKAKDIISLASSRWLNLP